MPPARRAGNGHRGNPLAQPDPKVASSGTGPFEAHEDDRGAASHTSPQRGSLSRSIESYSPGSDRSRVTLGHGGRRRKLGSQGHGLEPNKVLISYPFQRPDPLQETGEVD